MDIIDLRFFECVARVQNMNRAARELNTVQSNVTAKIRGLEYELGVTLFNRHSRGVELTSSGSLLLPYARQILSLVGDAKRAVSFRAKPAGPLVMGCTETVNAIHLASFLTKYAVDFPDVDISVRTGTSKELVDLVLSYGVEGAFLCGPVSHPDLHTTEVFTEELCVVSRRTESSLSELLSRSEMKQVVVRAGCFWGQRLDEILTQMGVADRKTFEFGTLDAIRRAVASGVGITFLPRRLVEDVWGGDAYTLHEVEPEMSMVSTLFVRRRDSYVSPALSAFLGSLAATNRDHGVDTANVRLREAESV